VRRDAGQVLLGAILLFVGGFFILRDLGYVRGENILMFVGLGFIVSYLFAGRRAGLLVPGTILVAIGTFTSLQQMRFWHSGAGPGWFFILLGLAFAAIFVIDSAGRAEPTVWPLYPAAALCVFGLLALSVDSIPSLYRILGRDMWPVLLIVLGLVILFKPRSH
jgi:hypothetical protein